MMLQSSLTSYLIWIVSYTSRTVDMSISSEDSGHAKLLVEGKAITFRFLSDEERSQRLKNKKKGGRR